MLEKRGFICKTAGTEAEAIRLISEGFFPESAMVDFLIPVGRITRDIDGELHGLTGGARLIKFIMKETEGRCRTILTTGLNSYREHAQESGAWGYCSKPVADWLVLFDILGEGYLRDNEVGKFPLDVNTEIGRRSVER